jgi:hypothetical protein
VCRNTRAALTTQLVSATGVAVANHATARQNRKVGSSMKDEEREAVDQLANSLQTITLLATCLRRDLIASMQHAIDLEGATDKAVRAMKRLQPPKKSL